MKTKNKRQRSRDLIPLLEVCLVSLNPELGKNVWRLLGHAEVALCKVSPAELQLLEDAAKLAGLSDFQVLGSYLGTYFWVTYLCYLWVPVFGCQFLTHSHLTF